MKLIKVILIFVFIYNVSCLKVLSQEYFYILNDKCIKDLTELANINLSNDEFEIIKDSRGIIIRYELELKENFLEINTKTYKKSLKIKDFLAKIKNSVIIEVHITKEVADNYLKLKKWELSTIIANKIEKILLENELNHTRMHSVGYGEFLPAKNTPNNGGKYLNRIDIMILCNISGE